MLSSAGRCRAQALTLLLRSSAVTCRLHGSRARNDPHELGSQLADSLQDDPEGTASALTASLDPHSRRALLAALVPSADSKVRDLDEEYVDTVFKQADFKDGDGLLDRSALIESPAQLRQSILPLSGNGVILALMLSASLTRTIASSKPAQVQGCGLV